MIEKRWQIDSISLELINLIEKLQINRRFCINANITDEEMKSSGHRLIA